MAIGHKVQSNKNVTQLDITSELSKEEIYKLPEDQINLEPTPMQKNETLEAWINGPDHDKLIGLSRSDIVIEYVEEIDGIAHVSFSKEIQENNLGSNAELVFTEQIAMIMQQFGFEQTQILVERRVDIQKPKR